MLAPVQIKQKRIILLSVSVILLFIFFINISIGETPISINELFRLFTKQSSPNDLSLIFYHFRLPKALAAVLVGGALGVSGLLAQTYFRNPLAGPDVLGINTGASLGVSIIILATGSFLTNIVSTFSFQWGLALAAIMGSAAAFLIIVSIASVVKDNLTILILGLMLGAAYSAIITILQYFSNENMLKSFIVWSFGSLSHITMQQVYIIFIFIIIGFIFGLSQIKNLNTLLLGDKYAISLGANIQVTKLCVFTSISILAGISTAFCGPIAFVAITTPHISRMIFKTSDHSILMPAAFLSGSIMLLLSDIFSQIPGSNAKLPINAVTSLMGIPIVIYILFQRKIY